MPTNNTAMNYLLMYTVHGEAGANAYPVAPGQQVTLIDLDNPVIYVKSANALGQPLPLDYYDLVKREVPMPEPIQNSAPGITKEEIADEVGKQVRAAFEKYFPQLNFGN